MPGTIHDFLQPQVILDVVSRVRKNQGRLGSWYGFHVTKFDKARGVLSGPNTRESPTRSGTYRIFDATRTVAKGRSPGTGPATVAPQAVGEVSFTAARFHEKMRLEAEELGNLSPVVGPNSQLDPGGQDYLARQEKFIVSRFNNAVEIVTAGMIRGTWYLKNSGEEWIPVLTAPSSGTPYVTINHQVPSGNLNQLNMLGAGDIIDITWSNPSAKIISVHLPKIAQAFAQLTGMALTDAWCDPITWGYIMTNTEVINSAGSANTPFREFEYVRENGDDGKQLVEWVAVLRGYPTLRWHITADVLVTDGGTDPSYSSGTGTLEQVIPANKVLFQPPIDNDWVDLIHCAEYVSDAPGMPMVRRPGFYFWHEWVTQPTAVELIGLMNVMPRLKVPKAQALGTVIF